MPQPGEPDPRTIAHWATAEWREGAVAWADDRLAEVGARRDGEVSQPRVRAWATVLRIPSTAGVVWLKAASRDTAFEVRTADPGTAWLPEPALHAFTPERAGALGVTVPGFVEDSTYWSPSWTLARGAIQYTDIRDAARSMRAVGAGTLLSEELHELQLSPRLRGLTQPVEGCPTCFAHDESYTFGLGVVLTGDWVIQTPLFFGWAGAAGALPSEDISVAVAVTYEPSAYSDGGTTNRADTILRTVAGVVAPDHAPPPPRGR